MMPEMKGATLESADYGIEMQHIYKTFGGVHALKDVSLRVKLGEIHALVGQNGAGKSTLMKILSGAYPKDSGEITICGKSFVGNSNVIEMRKMGLGIIYQEFALAPDITVAENIFINRLELGKKRIHWKELYKSAQEIIDRLGFEIDPKAKVGGLSVAYQQVVEIAKTLSEDVKVLVLDEPTAVLSPKETEQLFFLLRKLKEDGVSIIYISHRLDEIFSLSDRISVMRDGELVKTVETQKTDLREIIHLMIGRNYDAMFEKRNFALGAPVLSVEELCNGSFVSDVSFTVHEGEVLGITGLVGAGKTETARAIFGADKNIKGTIKINDKPVSIKTPRDAVKAGIAYLPESRKEDGVILSKSLRVNTSMAAIHKVTGLFTVIKQKKEKSDTQELIEKLRIKARSTEMRVGDLSGGNQQKVSLAKWLFSDNKILILDEPTRGVDVGAKVEIYGIINDLARSGMAIVLISSELEEIIGLSDRVLVLNKGKPIGFLEREEIDQGRIMRYAVGVTDEEK